MLACCHALKLTKSDAVLAIAQTAVNVLEFLTLVFCQTYLDKQDRPRSDCFYRSSLIRVFPVCCFDKYFADSSPENQHFI